MGRAREREEFENLRNHVLRGERSADEPPGLGFEQVDALLALRVAAPERGHEEDDRMGSILLGATLIAGIYGMNFTHMPELRWYLGYPARSAMMLILTGSLFFFLKRRDWL